MATTTTTTTQALPPPSSPSPSPPPPTNPLQIYDFAFTPFLKREYRFGLDPSRPYCKAFREGHCPLGADCPDKHQVTHSFNNLVCKHWLRGLCKKGEMCEFLHEYNLRKMPDCTHYNRTLSCPNTADCLYLHRDPSLTPPPCPHYNRGFCPLGPSCAKSHIQRIFCRFYLAGFCPYGRGNDGKGCREGAHPKWVEDKHLERPSVRVERTEEERREERERRREVLEGRDAEWGDRNGGRRGGRGGRWRERRGGQGRY